MAPEGHESDARLVDAALAGDNGAFSTLMSHHKDGLYRFVRAYVGDADEALDLVQEAFVAAWTRLPGFDRARSFPIWLRRIALNKCRDWGRRRKVRRFFYAAATLDHLDQITSSRAPHDHETSLETQLAVLDAAIAALPRTLKEPLLLTVYEHLTHEEAASVLGVTAKAIETRIYRAKQALRRVLGSA